MITPLKNGRQKVLEDGELTMWGNTMKFCYRKIGSKPQRGFPLIFGLHGGGGCDASENDKQWDNHKQLYDLEDCIWFTPRSPEDAWNMWHKFYIDDMIDYIIQSFLILEWIDPNRVFISGYSAGGYGVYKISPRMSDRFAGCAMMPGHPNGADITSVRNTFFSLQVGKYDSPYNRNTICAEYGEKLKTLQKKDPDGYDHFVLIHEDCEHLMNLKDKIVFDIFKFKVINYLPKYVIWKQCNDVQKTNFYWLEIPKQKLKAGAQVIGKIENNFITITSDDYDEVIINLNDSLVNFNEVISVRFNNSEVFKNSYFENIDTVIASIERKFDPYLIFGVRFSVSKSGVNLLG